MSNFNPDKAENLNFPAKKGTPCVALFDDGWYRAKLTGNPRGDTCQVFFCDFGNKDEVALEDIKKMPQDLIAIPDQARLCRLAYVNTPSKTHALADVNILILECLGLAHR